MPTRSRRWSRAIGNLPLLRRRGGIERMAWKEKASAVPLPSNNPNNEYAVGCTAYTMDEYMKVVECPVDISEDSIYANHHTSAMMWDRIEARYNEVKSSWANKRNKEQLRTCWDRIKLHVNNFRDICMKLRDGRGSGECMEDVIQRDRRGSGECMEDVIQKAMTEYQSKYGKFMFYNWLILKDKPKFD